MDILTALLTALHLSPVLWAPVIIAVASALASALPHPATTSRWALPRNLLDTIALNWGHAANATPPATGGSSIPLAGLFAMLLLGGCTLTTAQQQQLITVAHAACRVDGAAQPVLVALAPLAGGAGLQVSSLDSALVHPMVVAACAAMAGTPAGVVQAPAVVAAN